MILAIDFGTSNTVVARLNPVTEQAETVALPGLSLSQGGSPPLVPSLLYWAQEGPAVIGQAVRDRGLDLKNDPRFFQGFKRGIGAAVQGFLPELAGEAIRFEAVGERFLQQLLGAIQQLPLPLDSLVVTVPVDSFEAYRHWLGAALGTALGDELDNVRMVDEPTAAALGYGMADCDLLLVVDFGGGTLDLSLVQLERESVKRATGFVLKWGQKNFAEQSAQRVELAKVLAKAGQNLGGTDLDGWLAQALAEQYGFEPTPLVGRLAERLKIQLSLQTEASEVYFDAENFESYELNVSRSQFEALLRQRGFFDQLDRAMAQVIQQARRQGIALADVEGVLLVGGTSQIPAVQDWLQGYFEAGKIRSDRPFEAIAQGALQLAQGIEIQDFLYHRYGIRYWNNRTNGHDWHPIIPAGQPYPMAEPVMFTFGASVENQPGIEIVLGELGAETSTTEVYFDGDRLITRSLATGQAAVQPLNDKAEARVIPLDPLGNPGLDRIQVFFRVDGDRRLRITVEDLLTLNTLVSDQVVLQLS
ncbi:MAG: Hsp70 family protein [Synechococcales cyanobacterium RM1_1_8]|nr:Hsp70 family protein [Synechococcales cyanobacterium RM1_1_8]